MIEKEKKLTLITW